MQCPDGMSGYGMTTTDEGPMPRADRYPGRVRHARAARRRHLPVIATVFFWSFPNSGRTLAELRQSREALRPALTAAVKAGDALVARGGRSFAFWLRVDATTWFVPYLAVVPQRRGHGTRLLADLLALADEHVTGLALECVPALVPWYERHGFVVVRPRRPDARESGSREPPAQDPLPTGLVQLYRVPPSVAAPAPVPAGRLGER